MKPGIETEFYDLLSAIEKQLFLLDRIAERITNPQNNRVALFDAAVLRNCIPQVQATKEIVEEVLGKVRNHESWTDLFTED